MNPHLKHSRMDLGAPCTLRTLRSVVFRTRAPSPHQVRSRGSDATWIDIPSGPGLIAVLAGELLQYVTSGFIRAAQHRVLAPPAGSPARQSLALRLRGNPEGRIMPAIGAHATVASFDAHWEETHASVNRADGAISDNPSRAARNVEHAAADPTLQIVFVSVGGARLIVKVRICYPALLHSCAYILTIPRAAGRRPGRARRQAPLGTPAAAPVPGSPAPRAKRANRLGSCRPMSFRAPTAHAEAGL